MTLHICAPAGFKVRRVLRCPRCHARRRHVVTFYEWYDPIAICCHCGAERNGGELWPRRKRDVRAAQEARALWLTLPRWSS